MVVRKHDYKTVSDVDDAIRAILATQPTQQSLNDLYDLHMLRGELELSQPAYTPRHRA